MDSHQAREELLEEIKQIIESASMQSQQNEMHHKMKKLEDENAQLKGHIMYLESVIDVSKADGEELYKVAKEALSSQLETDQLIKEKFLAYKRQIEGLKNVIKKMKEEKDQVRIFMAVCFDFH